MSRNSVDEDNYWRRMWNSFLNKAVHVILSRRIIFGENAKKAKSKNTKSFHFPDVDEYYETSNQIKQHSKNTDRLPEQVYYLDIFVDEILKVQNESRGSGLLSRKMARQQNNIVKRHILERWIIQKKNQEHRNVPSNALIYQKATILMRSLYTYILLLPSYKHYRRNQRNRRSPTKLKFKFYRVQRNENIHDDEAQLVTEELLDDFSFQPIRTSVCEMNISVNYTSEFRFHTEETPLISDDLINEPNSIEDPNFAEVEESEFSGFDPTDEKATKLPKTENVNVAKGRKRGSFGSSRFSGRRQESSSLPSGGRSSYKRSGTSFEEEILGSPPLARFIGSIPKEKSLSALIGKSFEERLPLGGKSPPEGYNNLRFSPLSNQGNSLGSYTEEHYSATPGRFSLDKEEEESQAKSNNGSENDEFIPPEKSQMNLVIGKEAKPKKKSTLLPPMMMDIDFRSNTPLETGNEYSDNEEQGMAFIDDEKREEDEEKSKYHELVGSLLNKIENAPILSAFYEKTGELKTEKFQGILDTLSKLEKGKRIMSK